MYCTFCTLYSVVFVRLEPFGSTAYKPFNNNMAANHTIIKTPSKAHAHGGKTHTVATIGKVKKSLSKIINSGSIQGWKMSGSAGSGAARKFLKELLAGNFLYFAGNFFAHSLL